MHIYKKTVRPILTCLLPCLLLCTTLFAQDKQGTLTGTVRDSLQKPVDYATVALYKTGQPGQPLKSTYTNSKGIFKLVADTGRYVLAISHAGFGTLTTNIRIAPGENAIDSLMLTKDVQTLSAVTVTAVKPLIEQKDDRIIYNAENDPAAKTESATDILRKTPLVTVDGDGNVQVNGQSNFKVLLNGRETSMFAMNVKEALKSFPGAIISKIEIITSPSAKYDAEGVGGLINIITQKKVVGYNASVSSYYSTLNNYSENFSLNMKSGKVGISGYLGMSGQAKSLRNYNTSETTPVDATSFSKRTLDGTRLTKNDGVYGNLELAYDIDSFKTVAFYGTLSGFRNRGSLNQSVITEYMMQPSATSLYAQQNRSTNPAAGMGADFIRRFRGKPEKELSFRVNGQFSRNSGFTTSTQSSALQDRYVSNESIAKNSEITLQADFVQPLTPQQKLETGAKAILRNASSDFKSLFKYGSADFYKADPSNSDRFRYHQEVYSAYGSYNLSLKNITLHGGLRIEHTEIKGDFETSATEVAQRYTNLIPNLVITRKFSPIYTLVATYNLRLQRPYITSLNPFVNNNDSLSISYGNPNLGPQTMHVLMLQNRITKGKLFMTFGLNGSYTNSLIVQYASFEAATGITRFTSANYGRESQANTYFNINTPIGEKLTVGANVNLRYNHIENRAHLLQQSDGFSGALFSNFNWKVIGKFTISGSGGYFRSPYTLVNSPSGQGFYQVNFGYKFLEDKLAVTMNVNNFHDRYIRFVTETEDPAFRVVSTNLNLYRVIYFGVTYNFGKLKENVSKKKGVTNEDLVQ